MARPGRPERSRTARSFRQLKRFHHVINSDKVFGTHQWVVQHWRQWSVGNAGRQKHLLAQPVGTGAGENVGSAKLLAG